MVKQRKFLNLSGILAISWSFFVFIKLFLIWEKIKFKISTDTPQQLLIIRTLTGEFI